MYKRETGIGHYSAKEDGIYAGVLELGADFVQKAGFLDASATIMDKDFMAAVLLHKAGDLIF